MSIELDERLDADEDVVGDDAENRFKAISSGSSTSKKSIMKQKRKKFV